MVVAPLNGLSLERFGAGWGLLKSFLHILSSCKNKKEIPAGKGSGLAKGFHKIPCTISSHFVKVVKIKKRSKKSSGPAGGLLKSLSQFLHILSRL